MKTKAKSIPIWLIATVVILLILIVFINVAHSALGRYTSSFCEEVKFEPNSKGAYHVTAGEWSTAEQETSMLVRVTKAETERQSVSVGIRVYIPDASATLPELVMECDGVEYPASAVNIPEDTAAYKTYGAGKICRFYAEQGNELCFALPDNAGESLDMTLILASSKIDTDGVQIIVEPINTQKGGGRL